MIDLKRLAFDNELGQKELGEILGIKQSQVSLMVNGRRDITPTHIDLLIKHFGKDTINAYTIDDNIVNITRTPQVKPFQGSIVSAEIIEEAKEEGKEELRTELSIPVISSEMSTKTGFNIAKYIKENESELEQINPSELMKGANAAERVLTTSMLPTFTPGDIVFVKILHDKDKIIDGATYYFNLQSRPTMIRKAKIEPNGKLRLVAKNRDFGEIIIDRADVLNVAKIVGLLRMTFTDQYDEIEALRAKKEQQVDNLIEHLSTAMQEISKQGSRTDRIMDQNAELIRRILNK
jgi:hypothetical protein